MALKEQLIGKKYLCKSTNWAWNRYLDVLIGASFQWVNRLFVCHLKMKMVEKLQAILSSNCWNNRL